ncbi:bifunctional riboflavin kinase/FAD synthetase [Testudinibacter sp. TR-2022]|uniref:bifunctional riboflavin kinase/FAD synthetase n=1 Tax=Testudinibacter sp. TR-2022 TaxID=2585029 RepID=UPI001119C571|nr:bifunctional riboflavin kinase/FAD synthetase [Testudinibacter sp. TR-2022]TNH04238.1 bifunctional riboflavin kinase/FAD synthetase [Pasteurellaceae bacterium Phil31]TNH09419.1 bifunctional riboflavin kinase/FAD synthetase [Testudinibacter sp. TR-2022]TNH11087.1 bifunctional riboflavin kinase/FAD synthetase [Testudinibacter sp. TR-2022]TNH11445.1 bifunctional riboflavin kinase/FAD synthetase [Testudinibacter sp. TR-2022]TNH15622.1 bifunctional riboflavin kinase/FAD synthetase [Testudinibact
MQFIRGIYNLPLLPQGCALTIGNFDGCHLGHQQILTHLKQKAQQLGLPTVVMLFEPQPNEFFSATNAPARLMRLRDKLLFLQQASIDYVLCVRFNRTFANLSADQFIQQYLVEKLQVKFLSIGDDFQFGAQRQGNFQTLLNAGATYGFEVENNDSFTLNNQRISSTLIRKALAEDDLALAEAMLGKPYSIRGRVAHGNKLGRTIGFPTANIHLHRQVNPIQGVYAVDILCKCGQRYQGVANIGNRPTVDGGTRPLLEVHIFDFNQNLYGQPLEIILRKKIRNEIKFADFTRLTQQIAKDVQTAKDFFKLNG